MANEDIRPLKDPHWLLGEILLQKGWIRWEDLEMALKLQKQTNQRLGEILVSRGVIPHNYLFEALAIQFGKRFIELKSVKIHSEAVKLVPKHYVYEHRVMPLAVQKEVLLVAMSDPLDAWSISALSKLSGIQEVQTVIAAPQDIEEHIIKHYGPEGIGF